MWTLIVALHTVALAAPGPPPLERPVLGEQRQPAAERPLFYDEPQLPLHAGELPLRTDERPLAIPSERPSPGRSPRAAARPGGERASLSPELARALREYDQQHLRIRPLVDYEVGTLPYTQQYWSPWWGWSWGTTYAPTVTRTESWAVQRGVERLDVPTYLETIGARSERDLLEGRIRRNRTASTVLYALAGAGLVATTAGLFGMEAASNELDFRAWASVSTAGLAVTVGGLLGGSFPASRARELEWVPAASRSLDMVEREVLDYNEELRRRLGLSPEQALRVEEGAR